ncbi:unnamed protein product [Caenorhabditis brenneri]
MSKASLIFKVCGLLLTALSVGGAENGGDLVIPTDQPLSMLHGEYNVDYKDMYQYRPTWASIWKLDDKLDLLNGKFYISLWPPKYCHAVYVCPFKKQEFSANSNFKTDEEICENEYIKYYPHIKKLLLKSNGQEVSKFWVKNRLQFDIDMSKKATLHTLTTEPENHGELLEASIDKTFQLDLNGKDLLILTNSRMCQVNKPGVWFYPIFGLGVLADNSNVYPKWLESKGKYVNTDYLPPVKAIPGHTKQIDLLSYLKEKKWADGKIGNLQKACQPKAGWKASGRKKDLSSDQATFKDVSVNSFEVNLDMAQPDPDTSIRTFSFNVERCHWFRMWITETGTMANYNDMKLEETIDFFINEGFYISPESDNAIPLPGVTELTKFTFRVPHQQTQDQIIDMMYGELQGRPLYHDQFKLDAATKNRFNIHIIKSPACEINMDSRADIWKDVDQSGRINHWKFGVCKFSYFK